MHGNPVQLERGNSTKYIPYFITRIFEGRKFSQIGEK